MKTCPLRLIAFSDENMNRFLNHDCDIFCSDDTFMFRFDAPFLLTLTRKYANKFVCVLLLQTVYEYILIRTCISYLQNLIDELKNKTQENASCFILIEDVTQTKSICLFFIKKTLHRYEIH